MDNPNSDPSSNPITPPEYAVPPKTPARVGPVKRAPYVESKPAIKVKVSVMVLAILAGIASQAGAVGAAAIGPGDRDYAWSVILLAPVVGAFVQSTILFWGGVRNTKLAYGHVFATNFILLFGILFFGLEGIVCIFMSMPILLPLWLLGVWLASLFAKNAFSKNPWVVALIAVTPAAGSMPFVESVEPSPREVVTVVDIDASPEMIWKYVTNFPEIPADADVPWTFKLGYPKPIRCDLEGTGVGAMRYCVFTGGSFDERVTVWDEGRDLSFVVEGQPKKINHFINCTKGQFLLKPLPNGGTRVTGTTWYGIRMTPSFYFGLWSDKLIHDIHVGVLEHIKRLAEAEAVN